MRGNEVVETGIVREEKGEGEKLGRSAGGAVEGGGGVEERGCAGCIANEELRITSC